MPNQRQPNKAGGAKPAQNPKNYKPKSTTRGTLAPKKNNNNNARNNNTNTRNNNNTRNNGKNGSR